MGRDREFKFERRDDLNRREFRWDWTNTVTYPEPFDRLNVQPHALETNGSVSRPLKTRVSYAPTVVDQDGDFDETDRRFSPGVRYLSLSSACDEVSELLPEFNHWWWLETPYEAFDGFKDPLPMAWWLMEGLDGDVAVADFSRSLARAATVRFVTYLPGATRTVSLATRQATAGTLDSALVGQAFGPVKTAFVYTPAEPRPTTAGEAVLWIGLVGSPDNLWLTTEEAFGETGRVPRLTGTQLAFDGGARKLYLLGDEPGSGEAALGRRNVLHALDLASGDWTRLGPVEALGDLRGYAMTWDPLTRRMVLFGGTIGGEPSPRILALDPDGLTITRLGATAPAGVARSGAGITLDPLGRRLYVYGGSASDALLGDLWSTDLGGQDWQPVSGTGGPGALSRPMVVHDRRSNKVWVAADSGQDPTPAARPWELDLPAGTWTVRPSLSTAPPDPGQAEVTVSPEAAFTATLQASAGAPLWGEVWRVAVDTTEPGLVVTVTDARGVPVARDAAGFGPYAAVVVTQPGERYLVEVALAEGEPARTVPVTVRLQAADLVAAGRYWERADVTHVVADGGVAYVGHALGVTAVDVSDPMYPVTLSTAWTQGLVQEVELCGPHHLCAVQTFGTKDLVVLDRSDPTNLEAVGRVELPGMCRSLAIHAGRVLVGCGGSVEVVSLTAPTAPVVQARWAMSGAVTDVKVHGWWLVVALASGKVRLLDLGGGVEPVLKAEAVTSGKPVETWVSGGRLHVAEVTGGLAWGLCAAGVRCGFGSAVEVYAIDAAAGSLERLGTYGGEAIRVPFAAGAGEVLIEPKVIGFQVYRAEPRP
jgi:hypothetical protein